MSSLPIDIELFNFIHPKICNPSSWVLFNEFVTKNSQHIWFCLVLLIAVFKKKNFWYPALMCVAGFIISWHLCDEYIKPIFARPRPFLELGTCLFASRPDNSSFPSGHMLTAACMATLLCLYNKEKWLWFIAIAFALFVGYTRIFLGVHFPSDILGGSILGYLMGLIWYLTTEWARKNYQKA